MNKANQEDLGRLSFSGTLSLVLRRVPLLISETAPGFSSGAGELQEDGEPSLQEMFNSIYAWARLRPEHLEVDPALDEQKGRSPANFQDTNQYTPAAQGQPPEAAFTSLVPSIVPNQQPLANVVSEEYWINDQHMGQAQLRQSLEQPKRLQLQRQQLSHQPPLQHENKCPSNDSAPQRLGSGDDVLSEFEALVQECGLDPFFLGLQSVKLHKQLLIHWASQSSFLLLCVLDERGQRSSRTTCGGVAKRIIFLSRD